MTQPVRARRRPTVPTERCVALTAAPSLSSRRATAKDVVEDSAGLLASAEDARNRLAPGGRERVHPGLAASKGATRMCCGIRIYGCPCTNDRHDTGTDRPVK